jgi:cell division protein FtsL
MAKPFRNSAEVLADHALQRGPQQSMAGKNSEAFDPPTLTPREPMVYRGTMPAPPVTQTHAGAIVTPKNRRITQRKISTFSIILMLLGAAAAIVLYISNIIAVDRLHAEINSLQTQHQKIVSEQEILRAEVNRLASLERINRKAEEELGLVNPKDPPVWITADGEKIREVEAGLTQRSTKPSPPR